MKRAAQFILAFTALTACQRPLIVPPVHYGVHRYTAKSSAANLNVYWQNVDGTDCAKMTHAIVAGETRPYATYFIEFAPEYERWNVEVNNGWRYWDTLPEAEAYVHTRCIEDAHHDAPVAGCVPDAVTHACVQQ